MNLKLRGLLLLGTTSIALVAGCATSASRPRHLPDDSYMPKVDSYTGLQGVETLLPKNHDGSIVQRLAELGIKALAKGDLVAANQHFNQALMFDPSDSKLQWLNGVTYHLRVVEGEASQFPMAQEAYNLAIQFDPSNWRAHYQMGLLYMDNQDFAEAQSSLAEALLFRPRDPDLLYQMVCASYYNYDPQTAAAALQQLQLLEPDSARTLRAAPAVLAAVGEAEQAQQEFGRYTSMSPSSKQTKLLGDRLEDWQALYQLHQADTLTLAAAQAPDDTDGRLAGEEQGESESPPESENAFAHDLESEMVIVDIAIIESEEDLGTRKGVNLLNGLRIQYGLDRFTTDQRDESRTVLGEGSDSIVDTFTRTLTKAISIPQLDYSLNIFNSAIFKNEVLARPTLIALNGEASHFFAGKNVRAAATATSNIGTVAGGEAIEIDQDIGVDLSVAPTLRNDGLVRIDVDVTRTFLEEPDSAIDYQFKIQTAKTHVSASVVMAFGETLILSGLSEQESETFRDGVPLLQDIPIIQYLFSEERVIDFQKSVLVMLTPRRPFTLSNWADERLKSEDVPAEEESLRQLRKRFDSWFKPSPHWVDIVNHLEAGGLFREFRTGDLVLEQWAETDSFRRRFSDVVEFLYF